MKVLQNIVVCNYLEEYNRCTVFDDPIAVVAMIAACKHPMMAV